MLHERCKISYKKAEEYVFSCWKGHTVPPLLELARSRLEQVRSPASRSSRRPSRRASSMSSTSSSSSRRSSSCPRGGVGEAGGPNGPGCAHYGILLERSTSFGVFFKMFLAFSIFARASRCRFHHDFTEPSGIFYDCYSTAAWDRFYSEIHCSANGGLLRH